MNLTLIIVIITGITSFLAFSNPNLINELIFWPYRIWRNNEWHRLITCGFIHADLGHLIFNMIALYSFGAFVENSFNYYFQSSGHTLYIALYFIAIAIADIYNLFSQKNNYNYRSLGASGGVSAVIFASILIHPHGGIGIIFLPGISIPAFVFGPLYLLYCAYMAKRASDNIGHVAHFTGAVFGFIFPVIFKPALLITFFNLITR